jgi:multicomponent Na+:H+ antiporter subunit B
MKFREGITGKSIIVKCGADKFLPFAVTFGIYIIMFGTISPGGGFQGGVIVASAALLLYLGYGYNVAKRAISTEVLRVNEACGASLYVILGLLGIAFGANFCRNVFFNNGNVGDLISAGTITFMGYAVGYKVLCGVGFLLLLMLALLAPDADDEEEEA